MWVQVPLPAEKRILFQGSFSFTIFYLPKSPGTAQIWILFVIHFKHGNRIACVICHRNMIIIREDDHILRIFPADRKRKLLGKCSVLRVHGEHGNTVFASRCTEKMFSVRCKPQCACSVMECVLVMILPECADGLDQFKFRQTSFAVITVDLDFIAQLEKNVSIFSKDIDFILCFFIF